MQGSRRIADPTGIETHVDDRLLDLRQTPAVAIVEQKTALGTEGVLAQVALCSPGRFPTFDDLVTLTVRASDGDERHGPFLPNGGYEDEAQCDSNLSPSPLLKHYLTLILTRPQPRRKDVDHDGKQAITHGGRCGFDMRRAVRPDPPSTGTGRAAHRRHCRRGMDRHGEG